MISASAQSSSASPKTWICTLVLVLAVIVAYHNSFSGPFVFDDLTAIPRNKSIQHLGLATLRPPSDTTVTGRPLPNLTFAVNYALGGESVHGYHIGNLLIHGLAGLLLFGVVRRTVGKIPSLGDHALEIGFFVALLWMVHPLQTESVTYLVQRVESLVALFYLLTLYCFVRSTEKEMSGVWKFAAVVACALGMVTKEVMASAPLLIFLYDRAFVAGGFREAWNRRKFFYAALALTWLPLAWLVVMAEGRNGSVGFGAQITPWHYALTQCEAIIHYLRLVVWPSPLVFDYGTAVVTSPLRVLPQAGLLIGLLGVTIWALVRRPQPGFVGALFFCVLAPSSSVVPIVTQTMAEHRIYLPLAAVVTLLVVGLYRWLGRRCLTVLVVLAVVWIGLTIQRNRVYATEDSLWRDVIEKKPDNARAFFSLGAILEKAGEHAQAVPQYEQALRVKPRYPQALSNLGNALMTLGRTDEALVTFEKVLAMQPDYVEARCNYGAALLNVGQVDRAISELEKALQQDTNFAAAHNNLGLALSKAGRKQEALVHFETAERIDPGHPDVLTSLGNVSFELQGQEKAISYYEAALKIAPDYADAHFNLGTTLLKVGRLAEALAQFEMAVQLDPASADFHFALGNALLKAGRMADAVGPCADAVRLRPDHPEAYVNLGTALYFSGKPADAVKNLEKALQLKPDSAKTHYVLGNIFMSQGQLDQARVHYEEALKINPGYAPARENLSQLLQSKAVP